MHHFFGHLVRGFHLFFSKLGVRLSAAAPRPRPPHTTLTTNPVKISILSWFFFEINGHDSGEISSKINIFFALRPIDVVWALSKSALFSGTFLKCLRIFLVQSTFRPYPRDTTRFDLNSSGISQKPPTNQNPNLTS